MIIVPPGQKQSFANASVDLRQLDAEIEKISQLIRATSPFLSEIIVHNKTKNIHIEIMFASGRVHVVVTNPDDEKFRFEESGIRETQV